MSDLTLADVMADDATSAPSVETAVTEIPQEQPAQTGPARDENGRFASTAQTEIVEEPTPEAHTTTEQPSQQQGHVPVRAVQEEREKRKEAQAEAESLRSEIAKLQGQMSVLMQQGQQVQQPKPQQEQPEVDLWSNPEKYLQTQMNPVQQTMQKMQERIWSMEAAQEHGKEALAAAMDAAKPLFNTPQGRALHAEISASENPLSELVKWHKRQETLSLVGGDPQAWFQQEFERRLASDPAFATSAMEKMRGVAAGNVSRTAPVTTSLPSLNRLPTGGNTPQDTDASDAAIFAHALR